MTHDERTEMIAFLAGQLCRYDENHFEELTDDELQERYNRLTEVEMEGRL